MFKLFYQIKLCFRCSVCAANDENLSFISSLKSSQVIINCVCAPDQSLNSVGAFAVTPLKPLLHAQQPPTPHNRVLAHMWQVVQNNNGIKVRAADEQWELSRFDLFGACGVKICPAVVTPVVNKRSPESEMLLRVPRVVSRCCCPCCQ